MQTGAACVIDAARSTFHGQQCTLRSFERQKKKWRVVIDGSQKELLVAEASLRLLTTDSGSDGAEELEELEEVTPGLGRDLPKFEVAVSSGDWHGAASAALFQLGAVTLEPAPGAPAIVPQSIVSRCLRDARPRLDKLLALASRHGEAHAASSIPDSTEGSAQDERLRKAAREGGLQFREIYSRSAREHRFDVAVLRDGAWLGRASGGDAVHASAGPAEREAEEAWRALLAAVDAHVQPVLRGLPAFAEAALAVLDGWIAAGHVPNPA